MNKFTLSFDFDPEKIITDEGISDRLADELANLEAGLNQRNLNIQAETVNWSWE